MQSHTAEFSGEMVLAPTNNANAAIVVLHEIYGINRHIVDTCEEYHALGYSVHCPNMLGRDSAFPYEQRDEAYAYFMANTGFEFAVASVGELVAELQPQYARVFLVGYSIGATIAWLVAGKTGCNGIVCHYGTRIRDYVASKPHCPALLIAAEKDEAFPALRAKERLSGMPNVTLEILEGGHGFCDKHGPAYHPVSANKAKELACRFYRQNVL